MTAHTAAHPAATPPRTGMNFSTTFPSTATRKMHLSSACSAELASPRPAPSAVTNSSRIVYAKVSVVKTRRPVGCRRTARPLRLKRARRGREGPAAECAVDVSIRHRTSTRTSARTVWLSLRHTGPINPSAKAKTMKTYEQDEALCRSSNERIHKNLIVM